MRIGQRVKLKQAVHVTVEGVDGTGTFILQYGHKGRVGAMHTDSDGRLLRACVEFPITVLPQLKNDVWSKLHVEVGAYAIEPDGLLQRVFGGL